MHFSSVNFFWQFSLFLCCYELRQLSLQLTRDVTQLHDCIITFEFDAGALKTPEPAVSRMNYTVCYTLMTAAQQPSVG